MLPGVYDRIAALREAGHKIAIASNQGGVAWGFISLEQADALIRDIAAKIGGADTYRFCPHDPRAAGKPNSRPEYAVDCACRKPKPGMLIAIMQSLGVSPAETVYVGDSPDDEQAAQAAGVHFVSAQQFFRFLPLIERHIQGYRATDIARYLGISRQAVSALAKRYGWPVEIQVGREKIYSACHVAQYLDARRRTPLLKRLGWRGRGLAWDDTYDGDCPICGGFAVYWSPSVRDYLEGIEHPAEAHYACVNGHANLPPKDPA